MTNSNTQPVYTLDISQQNYLNASVKNLIGLIATIFDADAVISIIYNRPTDHIWQNGIHKDSISSLRKILKKEIKSKNSSGFNFAKNVPFDAQDILLSNSENAATFRFCEIQLYGEEIGCLAVINGDELASKDGLLEKFAEQISQIWSNQAPHLKRNLTEMEGELETKIRHQKCKTDIISLANKIKSTPNYLSKVANRLCDAWSALELIAVEIELGGESFHSVHFEQTKWKISTKRVISKGQSLVINVYHKNNEDAISDPFTEDERSLVETITDYIYLHISERANREKLSEAIELNELVSKVVGIGTWKVVLNKDIPVKFNFDTTTSDITEIENNRQTSLEDLINIYEPEYRDSVKNTLNLLIQNAQTLEFEGKIRTKSGKIKWIRTTGNSKKDPDGTIICMGTITDITSAKNDKDKNTKLRVAVDQSPVSVVITDSEGTIEYVNRAACISSGYTQDELLGNNQRILKTNHTKQDQYKKLWQTITTGKEWKGEFQNRKKNGELYWECTTISPIVSEDGEIRSFLAIKEDVTKQKEMKVEIEKGEDRLRDVTTFSQTVVWEIDMNGLYTYLNPIAKSVYGRELDDIIGKLHYYDLHPAENRENFKNETLKMLKKGLILDSFENPVVRKNGDIRWMKTFGYPKLDNNGNIIGYIGTDVDMTAEKLTREDLKKSKEEVEEKVKQLAISNKELEQFANIASNDLQEPLRMVTSFMTQLDNKYGHLLDEKGQKYIYYALDGAAKMKNVLLDLLNFAQLDDRKGELEEVNINSVISEVLRMEHKYINLSGAQVIYSGLPSIMAYRLPLLFIFEILVGNAIKFRHPDRPPLINIGFIDHENEYEFFVEDNGIGIAPEDKDKVFIIFNKLHAKHEYDGNGMGLTLAKKQINSLGGKIWVDSQPEIGSTFRFTIAKNSTSN